MLQQMFQQAAFFQDLWGLYVNAVLGVTGGSPLTSSPESEIDNIYADREIILGQFHQRYGDDGIAIAQKLASCRALNGGIKPYAEHPEHYYPGVEYSAPIIFYFMRRALDMDSERAYGIFCKNVIFALPPERRDHIPTHDRLKEIVERRLRKISGLSHPKQAGSVKDTKVEDALCAHNHL